MQRYFVNSPLQAGRPIQVSGDIYHHMVHVMRRQLDDQVELVDPDEEVFLAKITKIENSAKFVTLSVLKQLPGQSELPVHITIGCGLSKGDKAEKIVEKGTELGADAFWFFPVRYSVARWEGKKINHKLKRLRKVAQEAAEQSHRTHLPKVDYFASLKDLPDADYTARLVAYEESAKEGEHAVLKQTLNTLKPGAHLVTLFGPEGGFTPAEVTQLVDQQKYVAAGLGPRILRAETAPLYLLSVASYVYEL
ncbi:RNA methyltransferase, RsmE family protein [Lactobacillus selangorensis]|uniref:Ribosomal RNA small subunit methyltransferase E n=1 Tax=Lactobacillus selangorensis TaxID=81857 RepID=A0A0R2FT39_9LACO|nr:16S rRNA (uracil(1498)-N(3))-methyltransferase [Lactobacillus selangorensis]KRN29541.1 RNA methyltransferase, RsmE family protein [Lactobacillus selangorensis]KRN33929.1 RNA methyltransferase, RsmE family protein [Lactobacillus selangorensis]